MNAYWVGAIVGAFIFGFLWSRLWLWLTKKFVKVEPTRLFAAYGLAWTTAVLLGAFGFANGGAPDWVRALLTYTPALALWLIVDIFARRGRASAAN